MAKLGFTTKAGLSELFIVPDTLLTDFGWSGRHPTMGLMYIEVKRVLRPANLLARFSGIDTRDTKYWRPSMSDPEVAKRGSGVWIGPDSTEDLKAELRMSKKADRVMCMPDGTEARTFSERVQYTRQIALDVTTSMSTPEYAWRMLDAIPLEDRVADEKSLHGALLSHFSQEANVARERLHSDELWAGILRD